MSYYPPSGASPATSDDILLPYDQDAEAAVVCSCIIDRDATLAVAPILKPEMFYTPAYGTVYAAVLRLYEKRVNPDLINLQSELGRQGCDLGELEPVLDALVDHTPTAVFAADYARSVRDCWRRRREIEVNEQIARNAVTIADREERDRANAKLLAELADDSSNDTFTHIRDDLSAAYDQLDAPALRPLLTGFAPIDGTVGGFFPGQLIVLGARPSVGKTALACQLALGTAKRKKRVAIISLEMSLAQLRNRWAAMISGVNMHAFMMRRRSGIRTSQDDEELPRVMEAFGRLHELDLHVDDRGGLNEREIVNRSASFYARMPFDLLIIDHLHLIRDDASRDNRAQELGRITRDLKGLARTLNVPILLLSQLNREIEHREEGSKPRLADLRESGSIEQDADIVLLLHRSPKETQAELNVAKHRDGPTGGEPLTFRPATADFIAQSCREDGR